MTVIRSIGQQWSKSILAHRLGLTLRECEAMQQLFGGATQMTTVTNTIAALVFAEGTPLWLPPLESTDESPLAVPLSLHCLFEASRLLFVKQVENNELNQAEQLALTIGFQWSQSLVNSEVFVSLTQESQQQCQLLDTINRQLEKLHLDKRQSSRNMGS